MSFCAGHPLNSTVLNAGRLLILSPISIGHSNLFSAAISSFKHCSVGMKSKLISPSPVTLNTRNFFWKQNDKMEQIFQKEGTNDLNELIKHQDRPDRMRIQFLHSIVAAQCAVPPNWWVYPNSPISKFDCCPGKVSVNFSTSSNFRCDQFDSIASIGASDALILLNFWVYGWNCCADTAPANDCKLIGRPIR